MPPSRSAAVAVAFAVVLGGCGGGGGDKPPDGEQVIAVTTDFAHAFGSGDGAKACSLLTPGGRAALVTRVSSLVGTRDCAMAVQKLQTLAGPNVTGPFEHATAAGANVTGSRATATLTANGHAAEVTLEKHDGDWLLTRAPGL